MHDAANVLRRYLNDLPEPVVPLDLYEKFREPLRGATKQVAGDAEGPQFVPDFDEKAAIRIYQQLITELPPLNRQLLLYILDLLAVFAAKSEENRMTSQNLAAIFQPGMLSHPQHAMAPEEYRLNQCVIIFLIENQDHFLIGMQGTAADETTVKEVQSGTPKGPLTPLNSSTARNSELNRTASNASAGAESVRRDGKLRRNRSVSSKHSKKDDPATPITPVAIVASSGGLSRSNTVPSKRSPAVGGGKFHKSNRDSAGSVQPLTPVRLAEAPMSSGPSTPLVGPEPATKATLGTSQDRLLENSPDAPLPKETRDRSVSNIFQRTPTDSSDKRQPNKLRKKRIPGAMNLSAQSSNTSLGHSGGPSPNLELPNPLENVRPLSESITASAVPDSTGPTSVPLTTVPPTSVSPTSVPLTSVPVTPSVPATTAPHTLVPPEQPIQPMISPVKTTLSPETKPTDNTHLEKPESPSSLHSSNNPLDTDHTDEIATGNTQSPGKEKRRRWLSRGSKKDDSNGGNDLSPPPQLNLGLNKNAEGSTTSFASSSRARRSFQADGSETAFAESYEGKDSDGKSGPIGWIKHKYREAKENAEQKRNKSPPPAGERLGISAALLGRGRSIDIKRDELPADLFKTEHVPAKQTIPVAQAPVFHEHISSPTEASTVTPVSKEITERVVETTTQTTQPVETIKEEPVSEPVSEPLHKPAEPGVPEPAVALVPIKEEAPTAEVAKTEDPTPAALPVAQPEPVAEQKVQKEAEQSPEPQVSAPQVPAPAAAVFVPAASLPAVPAPAPADTTTKTE